MDSFIDFLINYKELLISSITLIVGVLAIFLKRKPKSLDDFTLALSDVLSSIPEMVLAVERPSCGEEKKSEVIDTSIIAMRHKLGRSLTDKESSIVRNQVSSKIELVLSTPKKKVLC